MVMGDECDPGRVSDRSFLIPRSESKLMVGKKRGSVEVGEKSELGHKRVKVRDLESVFRSEGIDTHYPKSWKNREAIDHFLPAEKERSNVTKETVTVNLNFAQSGRMGKDTSQVVVDLDPLELTTKVSTDSNLFGDDAPACVEGIDKLSSLGKQEIESDVNFVKSKGFGLDLNAEDISSSVNYEVHNPFYPCKNNENVKSRDASECGSSGGPLEEKGPMRVWKEMKQNGFLSSSHGGVPMPKPRGRKSKNDGLKKKMELAKKEQVDRFAKIAAPSGLLNGLNPGIINHVRNSKQVHSIIEALVKSEKHEYRCVGSKQTIQTKSGTKESSERKDDSETLNGSRMNGTEDGSMNTLSGDDDDSSVVQRRVFDKMTGLSRSNLDSEDDILALKLSASTNMASENMSSLSNEGSGNLTSVTSLSVKAANVASQWLELLHQDIKGRLAALRRSRKRVRAVLHTELPFLMSREFSFNQENNPYGTKSSAAGSDNATADVHRARWSALFDQMDNALSEEEKQLESWLNQVKQMQLNCDSGLFQYNGTHGLQQLGTLENDFRVEKADSSERDLAVSAAAASIYSTCNFLQSMESSPCF